MDRVVLPAALPSHANHCLGCGRGVADLPDGAAFCPACGRRLRTIGRTVRGWAVAVVRLVRSGRPEPSVDDTPPRAAVVVGYGNALWRLGWRYEQGRGVVRNVPEAMRCYRKSAGFGNVEAQARLEADAGVPVRAVETLAATPVHEIA